MSMDKILATNLRLAGLISNGTGTPSSPPRGCWKEYHWAGLGTNREV